MIAHSGTFQAQRFGESYIQSVQVAQRPCPQHTPELHDKFHKLCFMSDSALQTHYGSIFQWRYYRGEHGFDAGSTHEPSPWI